jgi:hypothetical protein
VAELVLCVHAEINRRILDSRPRTPRDGPELMSCSATALSNPRIINSQMPEVGSVLGFSSTNLSQLAGGNDIDVKRKLGLPEDLKTYM